MHEHEEHDTSSYPVRPLAGPSLLDHPTKPSGPDAALATGRLDADPLAADRFVVDLEEWGEATASSHAEPPAADLETRATPFRLLGRLLLVVGVSLGAFHHSVSSAFTSIATGSILVYLLAVPLYAGLAAAARARRPGYRPVSGVWLPDILLGSVLALAALGVTALLGPGLSGVYLLWRVDLLMLWVFLLGASIVSFGLRQVLRSWPFWVVLLLLWPFPVRLSNTAVSSATGGAVLLIVVVLVLAAYGHRGDDPPRWQMVGSAALAAGAVLAVCDLPSHPQRLFWPSAVAAAITIVWWASLVRPVRMEILSEHRVRGAAAGLVGLGLVGLLVVPAAPPSVAPSAPTGITALSLGPLDVPGFVTTGTSVSTEQQHYFGRASTWQRVELAQGDPQTGAAPDGRDVVVDVLTTGRPQAMALYPVVTTYPMGTLSSTPDAQVDLGHGIPGQLYRALDARNQLSYTLLTFSWRLPVDMSLTPGYTGPPAQLNQRITLIAVDDHRDDAAFPQPGNAALDGITAAFAHAWSDQPVRQGQDLRTDEQLLSTTARGLVHQRLTGG